MALTTESVTDLLPTNPTAAARAYVRLVETVLEGPANVRVTPDAAKAEQVIAFGCKIMPTLAPTGGPAAGAFSALAGLAAAHPNSKTLLKSVVNVGLDSAHQVERNNPMAGYGMRVVLLERAREADHRTLTAEAGHWFSQHRNISPDLTPPHLRFRDLTSKGSPFLSKAQLERRTAEGILYAPGLVEQPTNKTHRSQPALA